MFSNELWDVLLDLEMWNCKILDVVYDDFLNIHSITFEDKDNIIMGIVIKPHEGNNNHFIVRAEVKENFDRWGNASYEAEYDWNHFYSECYNPLKLYQELLCIYAEIL